MDIVVVGGDNINTIAEKLCDKGFEIVKHINGRKNNHGCFRLPVHTDLVLVFIDFVSHKLCEHIKRESKKNGVKVLYSKRSWTSVISVLNE